MSKSKESTQNLKLNSETLGIIYQHVRFLANFRFLESIKVLQMRHTGYEIEDFVQEVVIKVCELFETKTFPTVNHLKKMIHCTMSYHYLHEKRKYYYTKTRGGAFCVSIDEAINDHQDIGDTLYDKSSFNDYDLQLLYRRNLYIAYNWEKAKIIEKSDIRHNTDNYIMSLNYFINKQIENGVRHTCKYFKESGFYMTRKIFDDICDTIITYLYDNDLVIKEIDNRKQVIDRLENCYNKSLDYINDNENRKLIKV